MFWEITLNILTAYAFILKQILILFKHNYKILLVFLAIILIIYLYFYFDKSEDTGKRKFLNKIPFISIIQDVFNYSYSNKEKMDKIFEDKNNSAIITSYPHGIFPVTSFLAYSSGDFDITDLHEAVFPQIFKLPIFRDIALAFGFVSSKKSTLEYLLQKNKKIFITPGGSREINYSNRYYLDLNLKNEGFIKLAWEQKSILIPTFSEGENRIFLQIKIPTIQNFFY